MSQDAQTGTEVKATVIAKAAADPAFRQALVTNTKAAIEKELGTSLPAGIEWNVLEETATVNYLVLPAAGELTDANLEAAAGGRLRSNISATHNKTADAIVQNIRG